MRDYGGEMDNGLKGVSSDRILNTHFVGFEIREKKKRWRIHGWFGAFQGLFTILVNALFDSSIIYMIPPPIR